MGLRDPAYWLELIYNKLASGIVTTPTSGQVGYAIIDAAASGDNTIVAAVAGRRIRVLASTLIASAAVNIRFESNAGGTALTGQMNLAANGGFSATYCPGGHFQTGIGELLNLELSGAVSVDGWLVYELV